jgi:DNA-binding winged helix-turn-helix (wHTH) protein
MEYIQNMPKNMGYNLSNSSIIDDEENEKHSSPKTIIVPKGDDFFNNQNIQPSDNQKQSPIVIELSKILEKKKEVKITIRGSKRKWNQLNAIKRNLIQNIILKWLNSSIHDPYIKLRKIDARLFTTKYKTFNDIIYLTIKVIYSNNICEKDIKEGIKIDNNIRIIKNIEKDSDLDTKMNLKLIDVLKLFFNIETNLKGGFMKEGLQDYKQFFSSIINNERKKYKHKYLEKFINNLNEIYMMTKDNSEQLEKTTNMFSL